MDTRGDDSGEWVRHSMQLPSGIAKLLRDESGRKGHGALKVYGAASVALFLALPEHIKDAMCRWIVAVSYEQTEKITPDNVLDFYLMVCKKFDEGPPLTPQQFASQKADQLMHESLADSMMREGREQVELRRQRAIADSNDLLESHRRVSVRQPPVQADDDSVVEELHEVGPETGETTERKPTGSGEAGFDDIEDTDAAKERRKRVTDAIKRSKSPKKSQQKKPAATKKAPRKRKLG